MMKKVIAQNRQYYGGDCLLSSRTAAASAFLFTCCVIFMMSVMTVTVAGAPIRPVANEQNETNRYRNNSRRPMLRNTLRRKLSEQEGEAEPTYQDHLKEKFELMKDAPKIKLDPKAWYPETKPETLNWKPNAQQVFKREHVDQNLPHPCGKNKCFFPVVNRLETPETGADVEAPSRGYLVSKYHDDQWMKLKMGNAQKTWDLAKELERQKEKYDVDHIYANPPYIHRDSSEWENGLYQTPLGTWLDAQDTFRRTGHVKKEHEYLHPKPIFKDTDSFMVQEVFVVDETEAILFGCDTQKNLRAWDQATGADGTEGFLPMLFKRLSPEERKAVAQELESQTAKLNQLLEDYPCFMWDFQIYYGPKGRFIHMDMDRCFHPTLEKVMTPLPDYIGFCRFKINDMSNFLKEALETGEIPSWRPDYVLNADQ